MPFTHHSHSGQFCNHGKNTLEEIIKSAIDKKFTVFALTEHMPREQGDLYPEEVNTPFSRCVLDSPSISRLRHYKRRKHYANSSKPTFKKLFGYNLLMHQRLQSSLALRLTGSVHRRCNG